MSELGQMGDGGYEFLPGVFQYSAGVAALPGYAIERVRFLKPLPMREGFDFIAAHLERSGRPRTAFCACEMRSPAPFSEAGFKAFNQEYAGVLSDWGIYDGRTNPVARANVCPAFDEPEEPSFHAFCYTVEASDAQPSFVISGSGEAPEGMANYRDHIVARGDTGPDGMRAKVRWVLGEMERRLSAFNAEWTHTSAVQVYSVHDIHPFIADEFAPRGALHNGLTWHLNRPPVKELEYEMDCRRVNRERLVDP